MSSIAAPRTSTLPQLSGKHRKSKVNDERPESEFLKATIDTLKATIAKNDLEIKKLKESNDIKAKRIWNLESQVEEAKNSMINHICPNLDKEIPKTPEPFEAQVERPIMNGYEGSKVATLETRTNNIEHNISILTSKLDNLQFNILLSEKNIVKTQETSNNQKVYACDSCDYESAQKTAMKKHKRSCREEIPLLTNFSGCDKKLSLYSNLL